MIQGKALALVLVAFLASRSSAQGTAGWSGGYPKTGTMAGGILVKGTTTPTVGWTIMGGTINVWPTTGGVIKTYTLTVNMDGSWGENEVGAGDLTTGTTYFVVIQLTVKNMGATAVVAAPAASASAK